MPKKALHAAPAVPDVEALRTRLAEAQETLDAIRSGAVDALVVSGPGGEQVFTLKGADHAYRILIEAMRQGALILSDEGLILYANRFFASMVKAPLEKIISSNLYDWVAPERQRLLDALLRQRKDENIQIELALTASDGASVPALLSSGRPCSSDQPGQIHLVAVDLSEVKTREQQEAELMNQQVATAEQYRRHLQSVIEDQRMAQSLLRKNQRLTQNIIDSSPSPIYALDLEGKFTLANRCMLNILGVNSEQLPGHSREAIMSREIAKEHRANDLEVIKRNASMEFEERNTGADGEHLYFSQKFPLFDDEGQCEGVCGISTDITLRRKMDEALRQSEARFKTIFNAAPLGVALIDSLSGQIEAANPMFVKIADRGLDELLRMDWMRITHPDDVQKDLDNMALMNAGKSSGFQMEKRYLRRDGSPVWISLTVAPIDVTSKAHPHHLCMIEDIDERKRMQDQVREFAFQDALTQLPNRRLLNDRLLQSMAAGKRSGRYGALLFMDLDNFKPLNDARGHDAGDLLLLEVAQRLKACVREIDTVARFGGDEFVVLLHDLRADKAESTSQAGAVAEKIRAALAEPYVLTIKQEGQADTQVEHHCTASIGAVVFINHECSQDELLKLADSAMYLAKEAGRNTVRFCEADKS